MLRRTGRYFIVKEESAMGNLKWMKNGALIVLVLSIALSLTSLLTAVAQEKPAAGQPKEQPKLVGSNLGLSGKLGEAVSKTSMGTGKGEINPAAPTGFLGIPGGPHLNLWIGSYGQSGLVGFSLPLEHSVASWLEWGTSRSTGWEVTPKHSRTQDLH
jgi:hypothetical protein